MSEKGVADSDHVDSYMGTEHPQLQLTHAQIVRLWATFRAGNVTYCPRDGFGMALAVDGAAKTYRLVCTECGLASPWFGTTPSGLVFRSPGPTAGPGGDPHG